MNKMQMAHEMALKQMESLSENSTMKSLVSVAWQYADAMQAEADKRKPGGLPEALCEVDWSQAPNDSIGWMIFDGVSTWLGESGYLIEDAPSFGFTGTHIVERPQ